MRLKHWVVFIVLNIVISAAVTLALLTYWEQAHPRRAYEPVTPAATQVTTTPTLAPLASPVAVQPTFTPSSFPHIVYTVQSGDTLNAISRRFNVPLGDLLAANNLTLDAILRVGQQVMVPTKGQPAAAALPSPAPATLSSELSPPAEVAIEIRQVVARGDPGREAVVIANRGRPVNLRNWKMADNEGNVYTFPDLTLWPGGTITVHTGSGPDSVSDLYWKHTASVWAESGDVVTLSDVAGSVVARYQLP